MADMKVSIGFGWETRQYGFYPAVSEVIFYDLFNKIQAFFLAHGAL
jgi:hypothetical protein